MISYLMPARNAEATVKRSVTSVLKILRPGDELIVVEDCSTDSTLRTLKELEATSPAMRLVSNQSNLGVAKTLNIALHLADNSIVGRIDADDICLPWRRSQDLRQIEEGLDFGFSAAILFGEGMRWPLPQWAPRLRTEDLLPLLAKSNPFVHSTMVARKSSIIELGGYSDLAAEDYDLWIRAAVSGARIDRSPVPKILYRVHKNQITASKGWLDASLDFPSLVKLRKNVGTHAEDKMGAAGRLYKLSKRG